MPQNERKKRSNSSSKKAARARDSASQKERTLPKASSPKIHLEPFSFDDWEEAALNPPLTTIETKAEECEQSAKREENFSSPENAKIYRENADGWRKLATISETRLRRRDWDCFEDLTEGIDYLLVRARTTEEVSVNLSMAIDHALYGLHALAANGDKAAIGDTKPQ